MEALQVLAAFSVLPGKLYASRFCAGSRAIQIWLSRGTVYPLLSRLKAEGLLKSEWVEAEVGHARKYYQLTSAGRSRAVEMAKMWARFSTNLKGLLSPVLKEGGK